MSEPRTAFTFEALELFHQLTLQGKTTAWDFYSALLYATDNTGLNPPSVSHKVPDLGENLGNLTN